MLLYACLCASLAYYSLYIYTPRGPLTILIRQRAAAVTAKRRNNYCIHNNREPKSVCVCVYARALRAAQRVIVKQNEKIIIILVFYLDICFFSLALAIRTTHNIYIYIQTYNNMYT